MSERGFFAVDRGIWDHPLFPDEKFSKREAWMWLLSHAVWEPRRVRVGRTYVDLDRGQVAFALRFLARKWKWSEPTVRRFLDALESDAQITIAATREATLITICNYNKYQGLRRDDIASDDADMDDPATHWRRKEEPINHITNKPTKHRRARARTALPDSWKPDEIDLAYARQRGFPPKRIADMARAFANHHNSRGSLMADWQAAWRTWCENEIKFQGGSNGQRSHHTQQQRRPAANDFFAGIAGLAADIAGHDQSSGPTPEEIPRGRHEIDG